MSLFEQPAEPRSKTLSLLLVGTGAIAIVGLLFWWLARPITIAELNRNILSNRCGSQVTVEGRVVSTNSELTDLDDGTGSIGVESPTGFNPEWGAPSVGQRWRASGLASCRGGADTAVVTRIVRADWRRLE